MVKVSKQVRVGYTPKQMFDLVSDVKAYSTFIPLCSASEAHELPDHRLQVTLTVSKGGVGFSFISLGTMIKDRSIVMELVTGPFKTFKGVWRFEPSGTHGCIISLDIEFEFASRLLDATFSRVFKLLFDSMIESFKKEAVARYG